MKIKALLLGCGRKREDPTSSLLARMPYGGEFPEVELTRTDYNSDCEPDVVWDLNVKPWPFPSNYFDEVHAYNIMEHLGRQGDAKAFFDEMFEVWRVLKPLGLFMGCCPKMENPWVFAEPSHTRVLLPRTFNFLNADQELVKKSIQNTSTSDFRHLWKGDLRFIHADENYTDIDWSWIMTAIKGFDFQRPLMV